MEHFIRIAFWIVTLFGLQTESYPISDFSINLMRTNVICEPNSTFYSPTNVKEQCITNALECNKKELLGPVKVECIGGNIAINQALAAFDRLIKEQVAKGHPMTNSSECACEIWPQQPFPKFLTDMETLLQQQETANKLNPKAQRQ